MPLEIGQVLDALDAIASVRCPVYLVAAESDDMVPLRFVKDAHDLIAHDRREQTGHAAFLARHLGTTVADPGVAATARG